MAPTGVTYEQLLERVAALESEIEALRVVQRPVPRFEQTLFKNEQRFRDLVEMMNEGLVAADPDDRIAFANRRAVELLGLRGDEALGRRMGEFVVDGEIPLYDTQLSLRRGGRTSRYEITLRRADDLTLCVLVSARPVFDVEGAYAGSLAVLTDISERRRAEEALRSSESRLRDIVEHSTNVFYSHTADHVLTYVSPQARSFFACEPEEAMVRWTELVTDHPGQSDRVRDHAGGHRHG